MAKMIKILIDFYIKNCKHISGLNSNLGSWIHATAIPATTTATTATTTATTTGTTTAVATAGNDYLPPVVTLDVNL